MKNIAILILLSIMMILAACSSDNEESNKSQADNQGEEAAEIPEVEVSFEHEPLPVGKETSIKATVTQGEEPVPDAVFVEFEIWNSAEEKDSSKTIEAAHVGDGIYEINHSFETEGTYKVIAHTQVDDLHTMPEVEVSVGQEHEASGHQHSDERGKFMVHLMTDQDFKAGAEAPLTVHINHMEEPFTKATVKFEISSNRMDKHLYIDASESERGEYKASHTFSEAGSYNVNIHYEKMDEEIHGHQQEKIEVKE